MNRIVITGMGAVTPIGNGVAAYWDNLLAGACGISRITHFDPAGQPVEIAGEVKDFDAQKWIDPKLIPHMDPFMLYACAAAEEALQASGLTIDPRRTGIVMGTALAGMNTIGETNARLAVEDKKVGPRFLTQVMGNIAPAQLSIAHNIQGPSYTLTTACSSGGDAVTVARMLILSGAADAVIVMGGEAAIGPLMIQSLSRAGALSKNTGSFPFDARRDGFVIGEGGGAVMLERADLAEKRGATIHAELLGCAGNSDAHHVVAPKPTGEGGAECMRLALAAANLTPADVDYINAHGTATRAGDAAETKAICDVFGENSVRVSSTKGATGHLMGAGGLTELIACVRAIETGMLPPTIGIETVDPDCARLNLVINKPEAAKISVAMSNAFGFGGQNSSVIVGRYA